MNTLVSKKKVGVSVNIKSLIGGVSPWDGIPMVDSLDGVKPYQVVQTMNHSLIKPNPYNRVDDKRTAKFTKLIANGDFFHKTTLIMIDYITHELNDDHHKVEALKKANEPIVFMLADLGEEFRGEKSIINIAKYNDSNSAWTSIDKFKQSVNMGYATANILNGLKKSLDTNIPKNNFNPWNILNFALGKNCEAKVSLVDYDNKEFTKILTSKSFKRDFKALTKIINILKMFRGGVRPSETLKRLSVLNGMNEIDLTEFSRKFGLLDSTYNPVDKNIEDLFA